MSNHKLAKGRYHFAKLALFNVRLLHSLQESGRPVSDVVIKVAKENGMDEIPNLLHQGTFLQFAYTCLVWLWESAKLEKLDNALLDNFPDVAKKLDVFLPTDSKIKGKRKVDDWKSVIRSCGMLWGMVTSRLMMICFIFQTKINLGKNLK